MNDECYQGATGNVSVPVAGGWATKTDTFRVTL